MDIREYLIKKLGGFTEKEVQSKVASAVNNRKRYSTAWYKREIHQMLDKMFPGKEFDRARYRFMRANTMTTEHMRTMSRKELVKTYNRTKNIWEKGI